MKTSMRSWFNTSARPEPMTAVSVDPSERRFLQLSNSRSSKSPFQNSKKMRFFQVIVRACKEEVIPKLGCRNDWIWIQAGDGYVWRTHEGGPWPALVDFQ